MRPEDPSAMPEHVDEKPLEPSQVRYDGYQVTAFFDIVRNVLQYPKRVIEVFQKTVRQHDVMYGRRFNAKDVSANQFCLYFSKTECL